MHGAIKLFQADLCRLVHAVAVPCKALVNLLILQPRHCGPCLQALMARMQHGPMTSTAPRVTKPHLYHRKLFPFPFITNLFHAWTSPGAPMAAAVGQVWVPGIQDLALTVVLELVSTYVMRLLSSKCSYAWPCNVRFGCLQQKG